MGNKTSTTPGVVTVVKAKQADNAMLTHPVIKRLSCIPDFKPLDPIPSQPLGEAIYKLIAGTRDRLNMLSYPLLARQRVLIQRFDYADKISANFVSKASASESNLTTLKNAISPETVSLLSIETSSICVQIRSICNSLETIRMSIPEMDRLEPFKV